MSLAKADRLEFRRIIARGVGKPHHGAVYMLDTVIKVRSKEHDI